MDKNVSVLDRVKYIADELKRFPSWGDVSGIPYWKGVFEQAVMEYGSLAAVESEIGQAYRNSFVDFPSQEQEETSTQILERKRLLVRDSAGSGKTAPAVKGKYALEQLHYNGKTLGIVICPGYVISSWKDKIREYTGSTAKVEVITSKTRKDKLEELKLGLEKGEVPDFLLVSYDSIFRGIKYGTDSLADIDHENGNGIEQEKEDTLASMLVEYAESTNLPLYTVLDEPQHIKNPECFRSKAVRELALESDHLVALSGTIFPDSLDDIYELMSLFDNERYPTAKDAERLYQDDPRLIRLFLHRFGKQPVVDVKDQLNVTKENVDFNLSDKEREIYNKILESPLGQEKYVLLRIAATDARLVDPRKYRGSPRIKEKLEGIFQDSSIFDGLELPQRYQELFKLVGEIKDKGEKAIIFTEFREGVTEELEKDLEKRGYGVCRIDGSVSAESSDGYSPRDIQRLLFQTDPDKQVMIATLNSLREGQDVDAANNVIFFNYSVSPGPNDQGIGRAARKSQTRPVRAYFMRANATMDIGVYLSELEKRTAIELVDKGLELTPEQKELLRKGKVENNLTKPYLQTPESQLRRMIGHMANRGGKNNSEYLGIGENAQLYAENYNHNWDSSYSGQTARLIKGLLDELAGESLIDNMADIIDLGSGPATVSRITGKKSTCIDINKFQLAIGKREAARLGIEINDIIGNIEDLRALDIRDDRFDLAVMSLVLHYGNWQRGDRKRMLLEANRVLRNNGYFLLTIPDGYVEKNGVISMEEGLAKISFQPMEDRHGIAKALDGIKKEFSVYAGLYQKVSNNPESFYSLDSLNEHFRLKRIEKDSYPTEPGLPPSMPLTTSREICNVFRFESGHTIGSFAQPKKPVEPEVESVLTKPEKLSEILRDFEAWRKKNRRK